MLRCDPKHRGRNVAHHGPRSRTPTQETQPLSRPAALAEIGAIVGDPGRANMLDAMMDGRALTATELAAHAGVTPQTASGHLARLLEAGLITMQRQGRHRYHRLASPEVARMLEAMMQLAAGSNSAPPRRPLRVGPRDAALRNARTCYDHLAGRLAVALADALVARSHIELSHDGGAITPAGTLFLQTLGIDLAAPNPPPARRATARLFCRPCLDWSERRPHIGGALGAALCQCCFAQGWLRRVDGTRAVAITQKGLGEMPSVFGARLG